MRRLTLLALALLAGGCGRPTVQETVTFGQVVPLTGPEAARGEQALRGMRMAVEAANDAGGVNGRRIVVVHADAGSSPNELTGQAVRLDSVNRVQALFGGTTTDQAVRLSAALQSPTPGLLVTAGGSAGVPPPTNTFCIGLSATEQGRALAKWAAADPAFTRKDRGPVALLCDDESPVALAAREAFEREYAKDGRSVQRWKFDALFELSERTRQVVAAKPAGVLVVGTVADLLRLRRQLLAAGLPADEPFLFAGDGEAVPTLLGEREPIGAGAVVASAYDPADPAEPAKGFADRFREKFGQAPDVSAVLAHDALTVYLEAAKRAKTFGTSKVRDELLKLTDADVVTGKLSFTPDQTARRPAFVLRVKDGQTTRLARAEPEPLSGKGV